MSRMVVIFALLLGLGCLTAAVTFLVQHYQVISSGLPAEAEVVEIVSHMSPVRQDQLTILIPMKQERVRFVTQAGETAEALLPLKRENEKILKIGDKLTLRYNPTSPEQVITSEGDQRLLASIFLMICGFVGLFIAWKAFSD